MTSRKHKKVSITPNYIENFLILASTITRCVLTSVFVSLVDLPIGIKRSAIWLKICVIAVGIKV